MFINLSNHPSERWGEKQREAAKRLGGDIIDIPFPNVPPSASREEVTDLAMRLHRQISRLARKLPVHIGVVVEGRHTSCEVCLDETLFIHVMGEQSLSHNLIAMLKGYVSSGHIARHGYAFSHFDRSKCGEACATGHKGRGPGSYCQEEQYDYQVPVIIVVSTTERETVVNADGSKTTQFNFVQFREV